MLKLGIIKECKTPPDSRVTLNPTQCKQLMEMGIDLKVERSPSRCFPDSDYEALGIPLTNDISSQDILIGVKEVPIDKLISNKTYFFFFTYH